MSADQLTTLRYEDVLRHPAATATGVSEFVGDTVGPIRVRAGRRDAADDAEPGAWRRMLTPAQLSDIESVAGPDLRRVGYLT
jgi:hypothetical protein